MTRGIGDNRKDLGTPTRWICRACGRVIRSHTTTRHLPIGAHLRAHRRRGELVSGRSADDPTPEEFQPTLDATGDYRTALAEWRKQFDAALRRKP